MNDILKNAANIEQAQQIIEEMSARELVEYVDTHHVDEIPEELLSALSMAAFDKLRDILTK